jgi:hypothetical protein
VAHPLTGSAPLGCKLQSIRRRLAAPDATAPPFPGLTSRPAAATFAAASLAHVKRLLGADSSAFRLRHRFHHLRDEGARSPRRAIAAITDISSTESKIGSVVAAHAREHALAPHQDKPKSAQLASWR